MRIPKLKVCGMKYKDNIKALLTLQPDFIGFIFFPGSKRFVGKELEKLSLNSFSGVTKKVGVFVNSTVEELILICKKYDISIVQLHGEELPEYCHILKKEKFTVIKAFSMDYNFSFSQLTAYEKDCDYFLFDTKGDHYGGTGKKFDWKILEGKKINLPYFLSGGIDINDAAEILKNDKLDIYAIDINSKFEIEAGEKNIEKIKEFKSSLMQSKI